MNAADVARYLKEHPDFLAEHGELFTHLTVPHPHGGQAISLAERQLHALRDKIRLLEGKLAELIRFGEENDEIGEKVHRLTLALLEAEDYETLRHSLFENLRDDFSVPSIALRVWNSVLTREAEDFAPVSEAMRFFAGDMRHPYCGAPVNLEVLEWFGDASAHVRSVALIPLRRDAQTFGLLALGSQESERFYPEMGTLYVSRIGDIVASALRRQLG
ncbi:MAG: uncharacterized protein AzoDbin1_01387 [Azoarcus sp.]|uniref:DUF484 domain-containing protein n=1 Tax=Aromatoleum tolulyticum TaxID=34027 RepID=A0A1N7A2X3_9RHOO|nr:DUF484 family protein [Aromatoleum tolulyticum]MCK9984915.1 uncharacterized protein [Azoarcus sp.]SIR33363.1 hypothetical protein SAMN05421829_11359 [Aromatoleum tolulyticum]